MIYDRNPKNESPYVSVNTLIRPKSKRHKEISPAPPYALEEQKEQAPSTDIPLTVMPLRETFSSHAISRPDDPAELEADRVSEEVSSQNSIDLLRKEQQEQPAIRKKASDRKEPNFIPTQQMDNLNGGNPLSNTDRDFFESRFGSDFSNLKVHTDSKANETAEAINARAYTNGNDIVFAKGEYQPGTNEGKKLIAHELTHVIQQRESGSLNVKPIQRQANEKEYTITSSQGNVIKVGTAVTYDFSENIPEGADFTWVIENDPNTYAAFLKDNPELLQRYTGNANKRKMEAIARIPGTHTIRVDITKDGQYINSAVYKQIVLPESASEEDILLRTLYQEPSVNASRLQPGTTKVTPEVAFNILENLSKNQPPFKPELGKGGCSWFVTEGNPYTSVNPAKNIDIPVELNRTSQPIIFDESKLAEIFDRISSDSKFAEQMESKYREINKIPVDKPLTSKQQKTLKWLIKGDGEKGGAAEAKMWEEVGRQVKQSKEGVGEVILKNSRFSEGSNGKFLVVADANKIQVKGGMEAVINSLKNNGLEAPSVISEAARLEFIRVRNVGRVLSVFKWGGRIFLVVGIASDLYRIYKAEDRFLTTVKVVGGWTGATIMGGIFATWFTPADTAGPGAWVAHGVGTLIAGGIGYFLGSETAAYVYKIIITE
ncbi:MAG TPA: DUF4157 domain-containing protein [Bacillota bacterium]|nr:DUF4157 domain-containing protein [Bacillota bacterium]